MTAHRIVQQMQERMSLQNVFFFNIPWTPLYNQSPKLALRKPNLLSMFFLLQGICRFKLQVLACLPHTCRQANTRVLEIRDLAALFRNNLLLLIPELMYFGLCISFLICGCDLPNVDIPYVFITFHYCDKIPETEFKGTKVYFGPWLQSFQSMIGWLHCSRVWWDKTSWWHKSMMEQSSWQTRDRSKKGLRTRYIIQCQVSSYLFLPTVPYLPTAHSAMNSSSMD